MLTSEATILKLNVPRHVSEILEGWAGSEVQETPAAVLEALAEELCTNEELRTFAAGLLRSE